MKFKSASVCAPAVLAAIFVAGSLSSATYAAAADGRYYNRWGHRHYSGGYDHGRYRAYSGYRWDYGPPRPRPRYYGGYSYPRYERRYYRDDGYERPYYRGYVYERPYYRDYGYGRPYYSGYRYPYYRSYYDRDYDD
jgi:hypothetical protein